MTKNVNIKKQFILEVCKKNSFRIDEGRKWQDELIIYCRSLRYHGRDSLCKRDSIELILITKW
jgi:hypothetical protein